jgi:pyridoxal phosphate enzyme (YggS family)
MPTSGLAERLAEVRERIAAAGRRGGREQPVTIVAVTKMLGPDVVTAAYQVGIRDIGENKVQEALRKMTSVSVPVAWHLVGHLQRNKVKDTRGFSLIQSLDSARLADALHRAGEERGEPIEVLVQVNASREQSKGGFSVDTIPAEAERLHRLAGIRVRGVMTMAAVDATETELRATFSDARAARDQLAAVGHPATELSMGMSQDYELAVEEGATMVRLGTVLFGPRPER